MTDEHLSLSGFPLRTYEKLRYADTDRQGHVNNAVFSTMFETGRVELLYDLQYPLCAEGCTFVIARLQLDFVGEIVWPGRVDIGTRVAATGSSSLTLEQSLFQEGSCKATARTVIVQMDERSRRAAPLSATTIARLRSFMPTSNAIEA